MWERDQRLRQCLGQECPVRLVAAENVAIIPTYDWRALTSFSKMNFVGTIYSRDGRFWNIRVPVWAIEMKEVPTTMNRSTE